MMDIVTSLFVTTVDHPDTAFITVLGFVLIAVVVATFTTGDLLPQSTNLLRLVDVPPQHGAIEEEGSMDVVTTALSLLDTADVACLMLEDRIAFTCPDQPLQIRKYMLNPQPGLSCRAIVQIDPDHQSSGVAIQYLVNVLSYFMGLLAFLIPCVIPTTTVNALTSQLTDTVSKAVWRFISSAWRQMAVICQRRFLKIFACMATFRPGTQPVAGTGAQTKMTKAIWDNADWAMTNSPFMACGIRSFSSSVDKSWTC